MPASEESLKLLRSIDSSLKEIASGIGVLVQQKRAEQPKSVASDRDLDSKYGDPVVKLNPRDWTGPSFKTRRMSECPAPFLELLAETFDYFARVAEEKHEVTDKGKPVADFKRADAARARGWAKRIRDGKHVQQPETATETPQAGAEWAEDEVRW